MTKKLIIAEKPSVAADIAKALGGFTKHDDYFESEDFVLSSAVGHLLELSCPEEFEVKRGKWSFAHLPVIPPHFALSPIEKTASRLKVLNKLIKRKDVASLVNACDAGREGELIFNYIAQHAKTSKPVQRLWLQSMTQGAIRDGFSHLRNGQEMQGLGDAGNPEHSLARPTQQRQQGEIGVFLSGQRVERHSQHQGREAAEQAQHDGRPHGAGVLAHQGKPGRRSLGAHPAVGERHAV